MSPLSESRSGITKSLKKNIGIIANDVNVLRRASREGDMQLKVWRVLKMSTFKRDKGKWLATLIIGIILTAIVAGMAIQMDRSLTTTRLGAESYSIGCLDANGEYKASQLSIYTREGISVDGLDIDVKESKTEFKYKLFFYDEEGKFLSSSEFCTVDFDTNNIPEGADTVKIVITPTLESGDNINIFEISRVADLLTVTVNR